MMNFSCAVFSRPLLCGLCALALAGLAFPAGADPVNPAARQTAAETPLAAAQRSFDRVSRAFQAGSASSADVSQAAITLAEARLGAAVAHDQSAEAQANLEAIVAERAKLLAGSQSLYRAGVASAAEVQTEEAALALARARAALFTVVTIRQQELAAVQQRFVAGAASSQDKETTAKALQEAQSLFDASGR